MSDEKQNKLFRSIEAAKSLRMDLARLVTGADGEADPEALQDTFDGETKLDIEIRKAVLAIEEDEIFIEGCKARETELKNRRLRLEKRVEATRGLIEQAMTIAEWPTLEMDIGTVSLGKVAPKLVIDDESAIPSQFFKRADPSLDKAGLTKLLRERSKAMLEASKVKDLDERAAVQLKVEMDFPSVDGAHLETDGVSLKIRRS